MTSASEETWGRVLDLLDTMSMNEIKKLPGMPSPAAACRKAATDSQFGARYRAALASRLDSICVKDPDMVVSIISKLGMRSGCKLLKISQGTLRRQRQKDAAFDARISQAINRAGLTKTKLPESAYERYLELLRKLPTTRIRERGLPETSAISLRRRSDPVFDARYREVLASRSFELVRYVGRAGSRVRTTASEMNQVWATYLELLVSNSIEQVAAVPGMPGISGFFAKRRRDPAFDEAATAVLSSPTRSVNRVTPADIDALIVATKQVGLYRACLRPDTPSFAWVKQFGCRDGVFIARLNDARAAHASEMRLRSEQRKPEIAAAIRAKRAAARAAASRATKPLGEIFNRQLRQNDLYRMAASAASSAARYLQGDARDDLIADLVLGVLNGEYGADDMKAQARKYQTAYYGALRDTSSMDSSRSADDQRTLHDQIGSWDYG